MPELPEVETVRRKLGPRLEGRTIVGVEVSDERLCRPLTPSGFAARIEGKIIESLGRRGKYLLLALGGSTTMILHLRMTGTLLYDPGEGQPYVRARFSVSDGHEVAFSDPRRFGTAEITDDTKSLSEYLDARLGPEPFGDQFDAAHIRDRARSSGTAVKAFLLNQRNVAGVGNIYADEALFRARLHPLRVASSLSGSDCEVLRHAVVESLKAGIESGGATIDDFRDPDGVWGSYQSDFLVHRREGLPCPRCQTPIRKMKVAGRGTYCCESCQPRPRVRRLKPG